MLFSPDGRWLAIGEIGPQIRLLDRATGRESKSILLPPPADGITALAFSPDSRYLAAGCGVEDNQIHLWDLQGGTEVRLAGHTGWIAGLAFSPDGRTLASVGADQTVRLWHGPSWKERRRLQGNTDEVWAVAWAPDGSALVTGAKDGSVRYWESGAERTAPFAVLSKPIQFWGPAFLPDAKTFLAVIRPEGAVVRWDPATAQALDRLEFLGTNHTSIELSRDGRWLALGDARGNIQVWDFAARRVAANLLIPSCSVFALIFSPCGNLLAGAGWGANRTCVARIWDVAKWRELDLKGIDLEGGIHADFSPDERILAVGYANGKAAWWDIRTCQRVAFFDCHYAGGAQVAFSSDGRLFAAGGFDGRLTVWDTATLQARDIGRGYRNGLHQLIFSPDSRRLVASGTIPEGVVKIWDVETGRDVATLPGEPGWYSRIGFSPDGNTLFAASREGTALLWHAPSFAEIEVKELNERTR